MRHAFIASAVLGLLAGCGSLTVHPSTVVVQAEPVDHPYAGPMYVKADSDSASVLERSAAAGQALSASLRPIKALQETRL